MNLNSVQILLAVIMIGSVVLLGALMFDHIQEDWTFLESIYFVMTTAFTVGYGDIVPDPGNRVITGFFIIAACTLTLASSSVLGNGIISSAQRRITVRENNERIVSGIKDEISELAEPGTDVNDADMSELRSAIYAVDRKHRKTNFRFR